MFNGFALLLYVAVTNSLDFDQHVAFEDQAPHELPGPEIVDELCYGNFRREMIDSGHAVIRVTTAVEAEAVIVGAYRMPQVADRRRLATGRDDLLFVHAVTDKLASAAEREGRIGGK